MQASLLHTSHGIHAWVKVLPPDKSLHTLVSELNGNVPELWSVPHNIPSHLRYLRVSPELDLHLKLIQTEETKSLVANRNHMSA